MEWKRGNKWNAITIMENLGKVDKGVDYVIGDIMNMSE